MQAELALKKENKRRDIYTYKRFSFRVRSSGQARLKSQVFSKQSIYIIYGIALLKRKRKKKKKEKDLFFNSGLYSTYSFKESTEARRSNLTPSVLADKKPKPTSDTEEGKGRRCRCILWRGAVSNLNLSLHHLRVSYALRGNQSSGVSRGRRRRISRRRCYGV